MSNNNKKITQPEIDTIREMSFQGATDQDIATRLGRSKKSVSRIRMKMGWFKNNTKKGPSVYDDPIKSTGGMTYTGKMVDKKEEVELMSWRDAFITSRRYQSLKDLLSKEDLSYFVEQWAAYHMQLTDLTVSEENLLEQMIQMQIRINDNHKQRRQLQIFEENIMKNAPDIDGEMDPIGNPEHRAIHAMITGNNTQLMNLTKELKDLTDKYHQYQKSLSSTREQREKRQHIGAGTVLALLEQMQSMEGRHKANQYNELMKIAIDKEEQRLQEPHKFMDGTEEPPLLEGSNMVDPIEENNETNSD